MIYFQSVLESDNVIYLDLLSGKQDVNQVSGR